MSKIDASGADETVLSSELLEGRKQEALELLVSGKSVAETARTAGVGRATIFRWLRRDVPFRTAYNQWKEDLKESSRGRLLALTDKAAGALETALEKGDAKTALALFRGLGLMEKQKPECVEEEEVAARLEIEEKKRRSDLEKAKRKVEIDDKFERLIDGDLEKTAAEWNVDKPGGMNNKSVGWSNDGKGT